MKKIYVLLTVTIFFTGLKAQNSIISFDSTAMPEAELTEVVIRASKNKSTLKELPAAVSIISSSLLEENEIESLNQATSIAPNFVMPDYGSKLTSPVYIRGIGSRINTPSVGLYVDNVPYFEKAAFQFDFFDIERIEILRGPQGTLYGRNSLGGLINIETRSPMDSQGTWFRLSAAEYGSYKANISHYAKAGDDFAFSISGNYQHNDGFYNNTTLNNPVDVYDSYGGRIKLIYNITDELRIENIAGYENSAQGGYPYAVYNDSLQKANDINYNQFSSYDRVMFSDGLKLNYKGQGFEINNTAAYQYFDGTQKIDQDFSPASLYFIGQLQEQNMFSNEFIINSTGKGRVQWIFGAFGFMQLMDSKVDVNVYGADMWYLKTYEENIGGYAFFNQTTFKVTDNFSVTGGLRYDRELHTQHYFYEGIRGGNALPEVDTTYPEKINGELLPKIAVNYKMAHSSVYASFSTGYIPGGYNTTIEKPEHLHFESEKSHNYEVGMKSSLFNRYLYADLATFYTRLENQHIYLPVPSGRGSYVGNAGESANAGLEITLKNSPILGFEGLIAYGYTQAIIREYVKDSTTSYNGHYTPYIPRHTLAIQLTKTFNFKNKKILERIKLNTLIRRQGTLYWDLENNFKEDPYTLVNAKVSFIRKNIQFDIWGRNLFGANYNEFLFNALGSTFVQTNRPSQIGVNLSVNF